MVTINKKGGIIKIIIWIIVLVLIIGAVYMTYNYISKGKSSSQKETGVLSVANIQDTPNVNPTTTDNNKPPILPEQ